MYRNSIGIGNSTGIKKMGGKIRENIRKTQKS
jgi:hypothetical protein